MLEGLKSLLGGGKAAEPAMGGSGRTDAGEEEEEWGMELEMVFDEVRGDRDLALQQEWAVAGAGRWRRAPLPPAPHWSWWSVHRFPSPALPAGDRGDRGQWQRV